MNAGSEIQMQTLTHYCHSQADKKTKLEAMFFEQAVTGLVPCKTFSELLSTQWTLLFCSPLVV